MATAEAPAVTVTPARIASPTHLELFAFFDSLGPLGHSHVTLFEASTPGATAALEAWAAEHGHRVREHEVTPPGVPAVIALIVDIYTAHAVGPHIVVQRNAEGS